MARYLLVGVLLLAVSFSLTIAGARAYEPTAELMEALVIEVIDGDTIRVKLGWMEEEVRYIGIDAPEDKECYGLEATESNKNLLSWSKKDNEDIKVWLEGDIEKRDKYGRLLAYIYLDPEGNSMVNEELLSQGYALLQTIPPNYKYRQTFKELAKEAWQKKKGLWNDCRIEEILNSDEVEDNIEQYLGKIVTVQYEVASIGITKGIVFLNSRQDYKGHFTVLIYSDELAADFPQSDIDISSLKRKVLRVTGKLELYEAKDYEQPEIIVEAPWQIELIEE